MDRDTDLCIYNDQGNARLRILIIIARYAKREIKQELLAEEGYYQLLTRMQGKQINITLIQVYAQTMNTEETEAKQR